MITKNTIPEMAIVVITLAAIFKYGIDSKDIVIAAVSGFMGYLKRGKDDQ